MTKTKKLRTEKYIKQKTINDRLYFQVSFQYQDEYGIKESYSKSFKADDYTSPSAALDAACVHRDQKRNELLHSGQRIKSKLDKKTTVDEVFIMIQKIFPVTLKTVEARTSAYTTNIQPFVGNKSIDEITPMDIQQTLNSMITTKSDDNISRTSTCWRYIIRTAAFLDLISSDPMLKVVVPKSQVAHKMSDVSTSREIVDKVIIGLRQFTRKNEEYNFNVELIVFAIEIIYYTGIRPAECYALDKSDIQFDKGRILIQKAQGSTTDKLNTQKSTKTPHSVRSEPIVPALAVVLRCLIAFQPSEHLFEKYSGETINTDEVATKISYICKKIGVEFNLYRLRHKFSTDLVTANVDPRTIMELMGHNNIGQTLEYARSSDALKDDALKNRKYS